MERIKIGYDDNLGLPTDFTEKIPCEIIPYHYLNQTISAFNNEELAAIFIPAGTLSYLDRYHIIAQATFGNENKLKLQTNFVTTRNITIEDINKFSIGRVNQYCTTSFWAPMIFLKKYLPKDTVLHFQNTNGFKDMLQKTADNELGSAMVWDIIMQQNPKAASLTHELFKKDDLPTPVLIAHPNFPDELIEKLQQFTTNDTKSFFTGFVAPDLYAVSVFQKDMQDVADYFKVVVDKELA